MVDAAGRPRIAPQDAPGGQRGPLHRTVPVDGRVAVVRARRVVPADRAQQGADGPLVQLDQCQQRVLHCALPPGVGSGARGALSAQPPGQPPLQRAASRSRASCVVVRITRAGQRPYDNQATGGQQGQSVAHQMTQPALDLVALRPRRPLPCSRRNPHVPGERSPPARAGPLRRCVQMDDQQRAPGPASSAYRGREVLAPPQPILGGQHGMDLVGDQADRRARPLPRRVARIARPARVRMRRRKPWVFARRRLFGWKVRLLTRGLQECCSRSDRRGVAWLSPCAHEKLADALRCTA